MYGLHIEAAAEKIVHKLRKKNIQRLYAIRAKIQEIREQPDRSYKFLRGPLHSFQRVHVDTHFVLIFKIVHEKELVKIYFFDHHDEIYEWRP